MTTRRGYRYLEPAALARVRNLALVARGVVEGAVTGLHASPYKGFSVEFAEHRKYTAGDNLRHLDWRILGRTDRLYVKQYEEETNLRAHILLDTSASMGYAGPGAVSKLTYACQLTAVLSYMMMRQQDAVGLTTFDEKFGLEIPPGSAPRHFDAMMRKLETVTPTGGTALGPTLHRLAGRIKRRGLIILVSDLYENPDLVEPALHHFRYRRHEVILFHVLDPTEVDFPFRDTSTFLDSETGERLLVDPAYVRDEYKRQVNAFLDRYRRLCADCHFDYVVARTDTPYDHMLSRYLEKRGRL